MPERDLSELRKRISAAFNEEELRTLCLDLEVDYEDLPTQGKAGKVRELVAYFDRIASMDELTGELRRLRPKAPWPETVAVPYPEGGLPPGSPYIAGSPVQNPTHFFGRQDLVDKFYGNALLGVQATSICVIGARRSGKTSFLYYVTHRDILRRKLGRRAATMVVVYVDLQQVASQADFFAILLQKAEHAFTISTGFPSASRTLKVS